MAGNSESSQNDLLCRLKLSLDIIYDSKKDPLEKIGKLFDIVTMAPGSCGGGIEPLVDTYLFDTSNDYFRNVISEVRKGENRIDKFYTSVFPIYMENSIEDIYGKTERKEVGKAYLSTWGADESKDKKKSVWAATSTLLLKKDLMGLESKIIGLNNDVITGPFEGANLYDYNTNDFTTILFDKIKPASDGYFYRLQKLARDKRNPDINLYRLRVYQRQSDAEEARIADEEAIREGEEKK
jgi:hypothetical protein